MDSWNPAPPGKNNINHCKIWAIVIIYSRQLALEPYPSIAMLRWLSHHKYIYIHKMIHLSSSTQIIPKNPTRPQDLCSTRHAIAYIPPNKKGFCLGWESVLVFRIMDRWMSLGLCPFSNSIGKPVTKLESLEWNHFQEGFESRKQLTRRVRFTCSSQTFQSL